MGTHGTYGKCIQKNLSAWLFPMLTIIENLGVDERFLRISFVPTSTELILYQVNHTRPISFEIENLAFKRR